MGILEQYRRIGKNIITPDIKEYVSTLDDRIVELSVGVGLSGEKVWGVSEFKLENGVLETTRRGAMHRTAASARRHFNTLLQG